MDCHQNVEVLQMQQMEEELDEQRSQEEINSDVSQPVKRRAWTVGGARNIVLHKLQEVVVSGLSPEEMRPACYERKRRSITRVRHSGLK
jgi:hypothetical protein